MKKRPISILLILCMVLTLLPIPAQAAGSNTIASNPSNTTGAQNYYDSDVTWLGTIAEYKKTLEVFFDSGLRKIEVNGKYGLVDQSGKFASEPVYDEIQAYYWHRENGKKTYLNETKKTEAIFVNGYVQAVRNGKMGLLDKTGKEVIPCKYDAVGLPSEGICRIIKKTNNRTYIGYWNLEQGKEIVAPNKYVIPYEYDYLGDGAGGTIDGFTMPDMVEDRVAVAFDFYEGYALVPTAKVETVTEACTSIHNSRSRTLVYAQIIDKNGKEVLSGGPYPFNITPSVTTAYPQAGPYMVYSQLSTKRLRMKMDTGGEVIFNTHLESGIVGPKGIVVPAQYHGGVWGNSAIGWYPPDAQMQIIPELSLAITNKCGYEGFKEDAAQHGVINFSNKAVIPFGKEVVSYNAESKAFVVGYFTSYMVNGTKITGTADRVSDIINGYFIMGKSNNSGKTAVNGVVSVKNGKSYTFNNLKGTDSSDVSSKDTIWVKKGGKWGLVNVVNGNSILPFEYEDIDASYWLDTKTPYAAVRKNGKWGMVDIAGKMLLECKYKSIEWGEDGYINIQDSSTGKYGIYNYNINKITTPCIMVEDLTTRPFEVHARREIGGTVPVLLGNSLVALFDMDTGKQVTDTYLVMNTLGRGLFYNTHDYIFGPDGKIVFNSAEDSNTYTLVVKDGKVGSINASRLKIGGKLPTTAYVKPVPKTITPRYFIVANPDKVVYKKGEGFDATGLIVHYQDENGVRSVVDNSKLKFYLSGKALTQGLALTTPGIKTVDLQYNGKTVANFQVNIASVSAGDILEDGNYYMQILGKYVYPVSGGGYLWLELSDKKPDKPFTVKLINYSEERGPAYVIQYDGLYIKQPSSKDGAQLMSASVVHYWRINKYSSFCTIRDYGNQKLTVNASGAKNANGTKVTVWSYTGSAPEHAKIKFTPVK